MGELLSRRGAVQAQDRGAIMANLQRWRRRSQDFALAGVVGGADDPFPLHTLDQ
jgi:hypothetical protein